jgi:hypothetical protein
MKLALIELLKPFRNLMNKINLQINSRNISMLSTTGSRNNKIVESRNLICWDTINKISGLINCNYENEFYEVNFVKLW